MKENLDRSVWVSYLDEFTRRNQSRPTRLEIFGELGAQEEEHGLPFVGISLDADSRTLPSVEIMLGRPGVKEQQHLTHVIADVKEITPKRGPDGSDEALEIISAQGETSLLRFEAAYSSPSKHV
jgi:Family of unknown function (DUF5335)